MTAALKRLRQHVRYCAPFGVLIVIFLPALIFIARAWWEWTHFMVTKPWDQIFCIGSRCQ